VTNRGGRRGCGQAGAAIIALLAAAIGSAEAQSAPVDGRWRFAISPYLLMPYMAGTTGVGDLTVDVDATPGDIFSRLQFGAMLVAEANNGTWGVALDGIYMDLEQSAVEGRLSATAGMQQTAVELTGLRRVTGWAEVLVGGRLNLLSAGLATKGLQARSREGDEAWVDPYVGARLQVPGTGEWVVSFRGDVGGFGLGSDLAWQVQPRVGYRFSGLFELGVTYRVISMDYTGGGAPAFRYDMRTYGPEVGFTFHF